MTDSYQEWRREFFAGVVADLTSHETRLAAERLWDGLNSALAAEDSDDDTVAFAEVELRERGILGCEKWVENEKRRVAGSIFIADADGKRRRMKNQAIRAKRKRRPDGTPYHQQALWVTFNYDEVVDFSQQLLAVAYGSAAKAESFLRVRDAYGKHRRAKNAGAACRMAGIDPNEIEISDADIRGVLRSA